MKTPIEIIDTHTGGEPTRVIVAGGPELGMGLLAERRDLFRERFDHVRSAVVNEPRGSDVFVGALVVPPHDASCVAGVIFFNNVGYLGMCGHGTIGVAAALHHMGRMEVGRHRLETPAGPVEVELLERNRVRIENVKSYRYRKEVTVELGKSGRVVGDIAYGGNWFFLVKKVIDGERLPQIRHENVDELTTFASGIRAALTQQNITGMDAAEIDHIELFGPPIDLEADSKNFVLCPGLAYDRSPCGTGTSAKLACLYADGLLEPGQVWRQESIVGSVFEGTVTPVEGGVIPTITGTAFVNGESRILIDEQDPFRFGIRVAENTWD